VNELRATLDPVRSTTANSVRRSSKLVDIADKPVLGVKRRKPASPTLEQFLSGLAHGMEGGRGTPDQRSHSEAQATTASARSIRGSDDRAAGMVRGRAVAYIAVSCSNGCRLMAPAVYPDGELRTLQRRL